MVADTWALGLMQDRVWEPDSDIPRIRIAFAKLVTLARRFPSPRDFLDALPPREQKALPQKPIPADPEKAAAIIAQLNAELRIPPPVSRETEREKIDKACVEESLRAHFADAKTRAAGVEP